MYYLQPVARKNEVNKKHAIHKSVSEASRNKHAENRSILSIFLFIYLYILYPEIHQFKSYVLFSHQLLDQSVTWSQISGFIINNQDSILFFIF